MSWGVSAIGKAPAVAANIATQLAAIKCSEPEETTKNRLGDAIASALSAYPPGFCVSVKACGSQYPPYIDGTQSPDKLVNTATLEIQNLGELLE